LCLGSSPAPPPPPPPPCINGYSNHDCRALDRALFEVFRCILAESSPDILSDRHDRFKCLLRMGRLLNEHLSLLDHLGSMPSGTEWPTTRKCHPCFLAESLDFGSPGGGEAHRFHARSLRLWVPGQLLGCKALMPSGHYYSVLELLTCSTWANQVPLEKSFLMVALEKGKSSASASAAEARPTLVFCRSNPNSPCNSSSLNRRR